MSEPKGIYTFTKPLSREIENHILAARRNGTSPLTNDRFALLLNKIDSLHELCDTPGPKACVLRKGHGGSWHCSNSGTVWPINNAAGRVQ